MHNTVGSTLQEVTIGQISTPLGLFRAVMSDLGLARLTFPHESSDACYEWANRRMPGASVRSDSLAFRGLSEQMAAYFEGQLREFSVPLDLLGTPFQVRVWEEVATVPYGEVRSYADIARALGGLGAVRAVGAANGSNPVPIVLPCHRIIGSDGTLIGYGGGLELKEYLLRLEGSLGRLRGPSMQERLF